MKQESINLQNGQSIGTVIDLFCGAGGLSYGFLQENLNVIAGIDTDEACKYPYEHNSGAIFHQKDITEINGKWLVKNHPMWKQPRILAGCAPCQPFSTYNQRNTDPRWTLLKEFARLIKETKPDIVTMENVPQLTKYKKSGLFGDFLQTLDECGYEVWWDVIFCPKYGVPQNRSRLVLLASLHGEINMQAPTYEKESDYLTVRKVISKLPPIEAGEISADDPFHRTARMSELNLRRIGQSKPGGTWRDWDKDLVARCHQRSSGSTYSSVYGRMSWDSPSPTITTQFYGFGNGRFGHPEQDRAISLREGALLQGFPKDYRFSAPDEPISIRDMGRMIGNAVPPLLARAIARSIATHIAEIMA